MSNLGGRRVLDLDWVESWARLVNEDRVLPVIGRFFTVRFAVSYTHLTLPTTLVV